MAYKRSQIEDAICQTNVSIGKARAKTLVRIKRLLEMDRALKTNRRSKDQRISGYAFFSDAAPGKGAEILFQDYECFALDIALRLVDHGIAHGDVVEILRDLRPNLQIQHKRILALPAQNLIGYDVPTESGAPVLISNQPVFIAVGYRTQLTTGVRTSNGLTAEILQGAPAFWNHFWDTKGKASTTVEITLTACALQSNLIRTQPRLRGRN